MAANEPKRTLKSLYMGSIVVKKPSGMDTLNEAIDLIYKKSCENYFRENYYKDSEMDIAKTFIFDKEKVIDEVKDQWTDVEVTISPSAIYAKRHKGEEVKNFFEKSNRFSYFFNSNIFFLHRMKAILCLNVVLDIYPSWAFQQIQSKFLFKINFWIE